MSTLMLLPVQGLFASVDPQLQSAITCLPNNKVNNRKNFKTGDVKFDPLKVNLVFIAMATRL